MPIPDDDLSRSLTLAQPDKNESLIHLGIAGDTYTICLSGNETGGRFCLIDMHVPSGGGPGPHRHDFEETFVMLQGEVEVTFRGQKTTLRAGDTANIPANAPHQFHNAAAAPARMLCLCAPAGNEQFFLEIGTRVATRTTPPPELDPAAQKAFLDKAAALAPRYGAELLQQA